VIAATNRNLQERIRLGTFREDLFYRLNVVPLHLPPLRERRSDVGLLAKYFLDSFSRSFGKAFQGISPTALELLEAYSWPGNVRELRNIIERICIMRNATLLEAEHLPAELHSTTVNLPPVPSQVGGLEQTVANFEKQIITQALAETDGNVVKASLALKIPGEPCVTRWKNTDCKVPLRFLYDQKPPQSAVTAASSSVHHTLKSTSKFTNHLILRTIIYISSLLCFSAHHLP